jgi:tRNA nucleotidyltransferase (CCA-adding enzyme)
MSIVTHDDVKAFAEDRVNLKNEDVTEYRAQANRVREKVDAFVKEHPDFGLIKILLSGSLAKGTALKTLNDIDVAVYVKGDLAPGSETELLWWLAERLRKAYPQMSPDQIQPRDHVVRISFRGSGLDVDVAPVYYDGLPDDQGYLYSKMTGKKVLTSIPRHIEFIRTRKTKHPKDYAQVVRLLKWWAKLQKESDDPIKLKSFITELVCAHLSDAGHSFADYTGSMERFFTYVVKSQLKSRIAFTDYYPLSKLPASAPSDAMEIFDPVNADNNVASGYTDYDRQRIVSAAESALESISEAHYAPTKERAVSCWREVLGTSFMR